MQPRQPPLHVCAGIYIPYIAWGIKEFVFIYFLQTWGFLALRTPTGQFCHIYTFDVVDMPLTSCARVSVPTHQELRQSGRGNCQTLTPAWLSLGTKH